MVNSGKACQVRNDSFPIILLPISAVITDYLKDYSASDLFLPRSVRRCIAG